MIHLLRSCYVEQLAGALAQDLLAHPPQDLQQSATVLVGSRGMERWLRLQLARDLGICAGVQFLFPGKVAAGLLAAVQGDSEPTADAWTPDALAWRLLDALPELCELEAFQPVRRYLEGQDIRLDGPVQRAHWGLARALAELLDSYQMTRADWLRAWQNGEDPLHLAGTPDAWQPLLWRHLTSQPQAGVPLSERVHAACQQFRDVARQPALAAELARRELTTLHVFGVSSLPTLHLELLVAAAEIIDVRLYLFSPSPDYLGDLQTRADLRRRARALDADGRTQLAAEVACQNPLLTSLGRVSRDMQLLMLGHDLDDDPLRGPALWQPPPGAPPAETVLSLLQEQIRTLAPLPPAEDRLALDGPDASLQVHACHGPTRQAEVLRDALLRLFADDPTLQPRDVVVMTPDIETYAPLVQAAFQEGSAQRQADGSWTSPGFPRTPLEIADLSRRALNPVADALLRVLELANSRVTASALADWLALAPVLRRFAMDELDVGRMRTWIADAGIRWAWDAPDRERHGQPADDQNTVRFGLARLALGVVAANEDDALFAVNGVDTLPYDDMEGERVASFGRLAQAVDRLYAAVLSLRDPRPVLAWCTALGRVLDDLTQISPEAGFLRAEVLDALEELAVQAGATDRDATASAISAVLAGRFDLPQKGDRPVTGAVTLCALQPQRSVPFRTICLLGLDDGVFPRTRRELGFDRTARSRRLGDRDPRDEDRHLLLEALLSARDHMLFFYTGQNERTGEPRPPAVPLAELLDVLDATFCLPNAEVRLRDKLLQRHPVQPFSERNFGAQPLTFDARMAHVANLLAGERVAQDGLFPKSSPALAPEANPPVEMDLEELIAAVTRPTRFLLQRRLQLYLDEREEALDDREPVELDGLDAWSLANDLLSMELKTSPQPDEGLLLAQWRAQGRLPLGMAGAVQLAEQRARIALLRQGASRDWQAPQGQRVRLEDVAGVTLTGAVPHVSPDGHVLDFELSDPQEKPRRLLRAWIRLLALSAADEAAGCARPRQARLYGLNAKDAPKQAVLAAPAQPRALLAELVALAQQARQRPLPLFEKTSFAFARKYSPGDAASLDAATDAAASAWGDSDDDGRFSTPESADVYLHAVYPQEEGWAQAGEASEEFVALASQVWRPLFQALAAAGAE